MEVNFHSSVVFCNDLQKQREFYEKFLGQNVKQDLGGCVVFQNGFTLWQLDEKYPISRELGYTYEAIGNRNLELCFETEAIEDAVEKVLLSDMRILHNLEEEEWGQYTIRFYDPEGNLLEIGESMRAMVKRMQQSGMDTKAIAQKTGLKINMVENLLEINL
jgi:catechol 2,3-dioxygenase-like lactoylglutathione lyase family enzyme